MFEGARLSRIESEMSFDKHKRNAFRTSLLSLMTDKPAKCILALSQCNLVFYSLSGFKI